MTKKFEDLLVNDTILRFDDFGEWRKGSSEFGILIQDIMLFLRNFKSDDNNLIFKTKDVKFDVNKLVDLINSDNKSSLISFDIKFLDKNRKQINKPSNDGFVAFYNLDDNKKTRPWENNDQR